MFSVGGAPLDARALEEAVRDEECGAVVTFLGVVRSRSDEGSLVSGLHYEAHEQMAESEFEKIAAEARERFGACRIAAAHRTGELGVGEVAVAVAVAAPHRAAAFDACEYVIDELKARAPIWKKERFAAGGGEWRENARQSSSHRS